MTQWTPDPERITFLAATHTRGKNVAFGIRAKDRDKHMYVIGKSGMGKSTLLENMAIQDIQNGEGMIFIDPHGSTAEKLLDFVPQDRIKDMMYFAPFDTEHPIGFNILEDVGYDNRHKVVAGLMGVFERIWADAWSARMQYILQNTLFALLEYPGATIIDVNRMLVNKAFREEVVKHVTDPIVAMFWKEEFAGYSDKYTQDATPAIQNKIGQFVSNPLIRNILGQARSTFDFRKMMDERKIVVVNLSKGRMGEANAALLGSMLVIKIYLSALSRAEESAASMARLPNCYLYVDEFQNVSNRAFENILSESRKYKLCLTIANQYIEQMEEEVRNAVFGNVGTTIIFRVGPMDAQFLEPVFDPTFMPEDMVGLGRGDIYLTLMIDGVGSAPFSAHTLPPVETPSETYRDDIVYYTRQRYGRPRATVEQEVREAGEKWQEAAKEKHKTDSARGQKPMAPRRDDASGPRPVAYGAPRTDIRPPQNYPPRPVEQRPVPQNNVPEVRKEPEQTVRAEHPNHLLPDTRETKSPADVLRAMHTKPQAPRNNDERPPYQPKADVRDALKAAIAFARAPEGQSRNTPEPRKENHQHGGHKQQNPASQKNHPHPHQNHAQKAHTPPPQQQHRAEPKPPREEERPRPKHDADPVRGRDRAAEQSQSADTHTTQREMANESPSGSRSASNGIDSRELHELLYGDDERRN